MLQVFLIASLKEEDIKVWYKTPESTIALDESFLDKFRVDHNDFETLMEDWFIDEEWSLKKGERYVLTQYLKDPYIILNTMICRLYDEETNTHFRMEWFLMAYTVAKTGKAFNWASILSFNITNQVQDPQGMKNNGFYMTTYLIDAICVANRFPAFNWAWSPDQSPIHVYCSQLWEVNCKENFYDCVITSSLPCTRPYLVFTHIGYPQGLSNP
jgi:hypothetical protein